VKTGCLVSSDRASLGIYEDKSGLAVREWLGRLFTTPFEWEYRLAPDEQPRLEEALLDLADRADCGLILTSGGTGPAARDVTPEATRAVLHKELPGFGEIMRIRSFDLVPTSILSRATAGVRNRSLIINLPGNPRAIGECLPLLAPAIAEALDHLRGERPVLRTPRP
jgi:molybdopterin adenylyltransferase